jgi:hypothetical protein
VQNGISIIYINHHLVEGLIKLPRRPVFNVTQGIVTSNMCTHKYSSYTLSTVLIMCHVVCSNPKCHHYLRQGAETNIMQSYTWFKNLIPWSVTRDFQHHLGQSCLRSFNTSVIKAGSVLLILVFHFTCTKPYGQLQVLTQFKTKSSKSVYWVSYDHFWRTHYHHSL